jgi:hypothetical protein
VDLVEVLVHDVGLVEGVLVDHDHGDLPGGARLEELLALVAKVHLAGLEVDALLVQDHPGAPGEGAPLCAVEFDVHVPLL